VLNSTVITVVGNLTDNPELRFTPAGVAMARFTVAVNPPRFIRFITTAATLSTPGPTARQGRPGNRPGHAR
jgi:hypothetical protein